MKKNPRPEQVKKLEDGTLAVRWTGSRKFVTIQDPDMAAFVVFYMINNPECVES